MSLSFRASPPKQLDYLLSGIADPTSMDLQLANITQDSRRVTQGTAFIAVPGSRKHGASYIEDAVENRASVILLDAEFTGGLREVEVPVVRVSRLAEQVSTIAGRLFDEPSQALWVAGITGTNGKTSCAWWLQQLLNHSGIPSASLGTLGVAEGGKISGQMDGLTTSDAVELQRKLAELKSRGLESVVMEVSSHGLAQHRVDGVSVDLAIFTNLSQDHLDYHGDMETYARAKRRLFELPTVTHCLINIDDDFCLNLAGSLPGGLKIYTYSTSNPDADFYAHQAECYPGLSAQLTTPWGEVQLANAAIFGEFNLSNLICVSAAAAIKGVSLNKIGASVSQLTPVPGRLQRVSTMADGFDVLVDFAHTPDAVRKTLSVLRPLTKGNLWVVLGAGGDRDPGKRPLMASAAMELADHLVITNDNPRNEKPSNIARDLLSGIREQSSMEVMLDRGAAITSVIARAAEGDCIAILGKGHEDYQIVGDEKRPFSDANVAIEALAKRREGTAG